ncbi:hypothetical protein CALCODRAFT_488843 [Calocera cornea HHB12733]|uniref:Uncharacterized protein n=1 Tax=Calocera cornea HHB12733 TaxID=1353952 RepID=A0A165C5E1_9BASI|nr:hypothetical protein CALCODRAFT_488843 [Calocera cornea HHB12733]
MAHCVTQSDEFDQAYEKSPQWIKDAVDPYRMCSECYVRITVKDGELVLPQQACNPTKELTNADRERGKKKWDTRVKKKPGGGGRPAKVAFNFEPFSGTQPPPGVKKGKNKHLLPYRWVILELSRRREQGLPQDSEEDNEEDNEDEGRDDEMRMWINGKLAHRYRVEPTLASLHALDAVVEALKMLLR